MVGVNAQIRSDSGGNEGVGFAIPSNTIQSVASQLISSGKAEHAYLGVSIDATPRTRGSPRCGRPAGQEGGPEERRRDHVVDGTTVATATTSPARSTPTSPATRSP